MSDILHERAKIASLSRSRPSDDPELVDARRGLALAKTSGSLPKRPRKQRLQLRLGPGGDVRAEQFRRYCPVGTPGCQGRRNRNVNLDDLWWDRPDQDCELQQARGSNPRSLQLDETVVVVGGGGCCCCCWVEGGGGGERNGSGW